MSDKGKLRDNPGDTIDINDIIDNTAEMAENKKVAPPIKPQPKTIGELNDKDLEVEFIRAKAVTTALREMIAYNPEILTKKIHEDNQAFMSKYISFTESRMQLEAEKARRNDK